MKPCGSFAAATPPKVDQLAIAVASFDSGPTPAALTALSL
jgi:hypothetical protein